MFFIGDVFYISAVCSDSNSGISNKPEDLQAREEEYGHNRKSAHEQECEKLKKTHNFFNIHYKINNINNDKK